MRTLLLGLMTFLGLASVANAESFLCSGSGKYAAVGKMTPITVEWTSVPATNRKVLMNQDGTTVTLTIDKSNSGRSHYAEIVIESGVNSSYSSTSAKGSIYDMVFHTEVNGTDVSQVACLPNPVRIQ